MNDGSKQRIVGAFVLLGLGLIFFPLLFDFSDQHQVDKTSIIPPQPEIQPAVIPLPTRPEGITPAKPDQQAFSLDDEEQAQPIEPEQIEPEQTEPDQIEQEQPTIEPPSLDENAIPLAWVVQVASFKERSKAEEIVGRLQSQNYKGFYRHATTDAGSTYRVFVGPKISQQAAIDEKQRIDREFGIETLVRRFKP